MLGRIGIRTWPRFPKVLTAAFATGAAIVGFVVAYGQSTVEAYVPSGSSSSYIWPDSSDISPRCYGGAYTWTHGLAWNINTNTSTRVMTVYQLNFLRWIDLAEPSIVWDLICLGR